MILMKKVFSMGCSCSRANNDVFNKRSKLMRGFFMIFNVLTIIFCLASSISAKDKSTRVDVIYFHATIRCHSCLTIEEYINISMNNLFSKQLKEGIISNSSFDFLQPENEHYQNDYNFESQTLIISLKKECKELKWKKLDRIRDYFSDILKFQNYIKQEVNNFLKEL